MPQTRRFPWGRLVLAAIWLGGLGAIAAMSAGAIPWHSLAVAAIGLGLSLTIAVGVMSQRCGFFARPLNSVPDARGALALTFDDGPDPRFTPPILELLAAAGQRATFFVIGDKARQHPGLIRRIVDGGHELGNHTTSHRWHMALWSGGAIAADLDQTSRLLVELTGRCPVFFRPPAAVLSPRIAAGARRAGLTLVGYSVRSGDGSPVVPARHVLRRLRRGLCGGAILVLHDGAVDGGPSAAIEILPQLLDELRARGLRSVTLAELVATSAAPSA